jgi:acetyl esterase/lipase
MDRRALIRWGALGLAALPSVARADDVQTDSPETISLWPAAPPGGGNVAPVPDLLALPGGDRQWKGIAQPALAVFRPRNPDGSAVLIMPGGGYGFLAAEAEGTAPARRLNASGVAAFVLTYRLPGEGWRDRADVPLQDAQRAMRLVRAQAARFGIDSTRIGVLGFSAGGHLAASLATRFEATLYDAIDAADRQSARPDFAALLYPVVTLLPPFAHEASVANLLGSAAPADLRAAHSPERLVTVTTPPCFLAAAADDGVVPVDNALALFAALRSTGIPAELHVFERGGHGFGLGGDGPAAAWPDLLLRWGAQRGIFRGSATG